MQHICFPNVFHMLPRQKKNQWFCVGINNNAHRNQRKSAGLTLVLHRNQKEKHRLLWFCIGSKEKQWFDIWFSKSTHRNQRKNNGLILFCLGINEKTMAYIVFLIQPIGINEKALVLLCFAQESMKAWRHGITSRRHAICIFSPGKAWVQHWLRNLAETNCFRIQPIGINETAFVLMRSAWDQQTKTLVLYRFSHSTQRNQRESAGFTVFCFGLNETKTMVL